MSDIRHVLEELHVEEKVITLLINENITVEDLKTLKKCELDDLITKYGPRRRFGRALVKWMSSHSFLIDPGLLMAYVSVIEADPTIETHLLYLRQQLHHKLTPQLAASWEATFQYRRKQLTDQPGTVWDYLNEYKFLQIEEIGKALIEQDFDKLYPDLDPITKYSGNLTKNCENHRHAIIAAVSVVLKKTSQQKHKDIATSFFELAKQDSNVTLRVTGALLLLPFIFPYVHVHKTWKPTRVDIVESFIARVYSETEVEEHIERRRKSRIEIAKSAKICTSLQPYVLAIGPTWDNISHSHIIVDKVLYTCKNIIEAAELCFKLFHVFHSDYPPESKHVWQLIQQGFYK
ncbi:uncharacterized protein LOC116846722 isoform X2 [Odontomachus brunneus]|uniref:uncharacterized protein LOC116846722 isoform X2 n=1 Tax=Odontomachus brunneus TaxID=486640 RepID=UPI0013F293B1|nr:uncharacterized protein LOC116846722 isoform X2 [Odontomachus brunneus]